MRQQVVLAKAQVITQELEVGRKIPKQIKLNLGISLYSDILFLSKPKSCAMGKTPEKGHCSHCFLFLLDIWPHTTGKPGEGTCEVKG